MSNHSSLQQGRQITRSTRELLAELEEIIGELEVNADRNELIREMDKAILRSTLSPQEVLNLIVKKGLSKTGSKHGQVVQYRRNRLLVTASTESTHIGDELPVFRSICGKAILDREPLHYSDLQEVPPDKYVRFHNETKSELVVLIKPEHSARILGVLDLEREVLGPFDDTSIAFAELLAGQAAIAIEHAAIWSGIKTLYEISTSLLSGSLKLEQSYQTILDALLEEFDFEHGQILRLTGEEFVILGSSRTEDVGLRLSKGTSVCDRYLIAEQGREILVIDDIERSPYKEFYLSLLEASGRPMRSEMIVPLMEEDRLIGALNIESPQVGIFSDLDKHLLGVVGSLMASAITATVARTTRVNQERSEAANLALAQLGNVAQAFLHEFGKSVGDAHGKVSELREHIAAVDIPPLREGSIDVDTFVQRITTTLSEAAKAIREFNDRFDPNRPQFQLVDVDVEEVAKIALDRAAIRYSNEDISFRFESRMPSARGRSKEDIGGWSTCRLNQQIYDVIENLLNNAVEATLQRGRESHDGFVKVTVDVPDPFHVRLQVEDNGIGIPPPDLNRVFEYGISLGKDIGLGIGLWFCRYYVQQRGGTISCTSTVGVGTAFQIVLPTVLD